ncbi:MAG: methytransferase partner Trm112 [Thermoplasmata archaeon]
MKKDLMDILCCPVCKSDLELKVEREEGDEVMAGDLFCSTCDHAYKIADGIPNLLPPNFK